MDRGGLVPAQEGGDRRPAPLGLELGEALHPVPRARERVREDLRREHDAFASSPDEQQLLHATAPALRRAPTLGPLISAWSSLRGREDGIGEIADAAP